MNRVTGTRVDHDDLIKLQSGEYGRINGNDWFARPPGTTDACIAALSNHRVTEHLDGTITVSPSILITYHHNGLRRMVEWHGFLERGVWREV